ncbi:myb-like protein I [Vespa mandarinia]|uniref:myb-like protein I n=1 Tax=Vespa mandarinia TaxID=7446 RepID=UPI001614350C|nr:myb-like protein I [Vespa mandarinia]
MEKSEAKKMLSSCLEKETCNKSSVPIDNIEKETCYDYAESCNRNQMVIRKRETPLIAKNNEGSPDAIHSDWSVRALAEAFRSVQQQLQQVHQLQQVLQQLHQQQQRERQQRQQQPQRQQQQQQQRHQTLSGAATVIGGRHKGPTLRGARPKEDAGPEEGSKSTLPGYIKACIQRPSTLAVSGAP